MDSFYPTIFVAVLALFGLLIAALIYVAQTVGDRYSTKIAQHLLRGRISVGFWIVGSLALLLSALGLLDGAFPQVARLSHVGPMFEATSRVPFGLAALLTVILMLVLFWLTLRGYSRLISPLGVLSELSRGLTPITIRDIALFRIHKDQPIYSLGQMLESLDEPKTEQHPDRDVADPSRPSEPRSKRIRAKRMQLDKQREQIEKIKCKIARKADAGELEDPLADLFEYSVWAISRNNETAWRAALAQLLDVFRRAINEAMLDSGADLPFLADDLLRRWLERVLDETDVSGRFTFATDLSDSVKELCLALCARGLWNRVPKFLGFMQSVAARAIARNDAIAFEAVTLGLSEIGVFSLNAESPARVFDEVCKTIGWLGEKLILRGIDEKPVMPSSEESEELGTITEALYRLMEAIRTSAVDKYPLMLRDAIEVISNQMLVRNEPDKFWERLVGLFGYHYDLAKHLIEAESKNAEAYLFLVLRYFEEVLREHDLSDYRELKDDVFRWVSALAIETVAHNQPAPDFAKPKDPSRDLQGMVIGFMARVGEPDDWNEGMTDVLIKADSHYEEAWRFIKRAGTHIGSNFGLMFDPSTGKDYPPDDPRRR